MPWVSRFAHQSSPTSEDLTKRGHCDLLRHLELLVRHLQLLLLTLPKGSTSPSISAQLIYWEHVCRDFMHPLNKLKISALVSLSLWTWNSELKPTYFHLATEPSVFKFTYKFCYLFLYPKWDLHVLSFWSLYQIWFAQPFFIFSLIFHLKDSVCLHRFALVGGL